MGPIIWLIAAGVLALAEMAVMDFSLLMLALAALVTAGVAVADVPVWLEVVVFAISAIASLFLLRPILRKRLRSTTSERTFSAKELEGRQAEVVSLVGPSISSGGMVNIDGDLWSARAAHAGETFNQGDTVQVLEIDGTTAVVWKGM